VRVAGAIRDQVRDEMTKRKIGTEIYYPLSLHQQECYANLGYRVGVFPHAERAAKETIALPIFGELTPAQRTHVAQTLVEIVRKLS